MSGASEPGTQTSGERVALDLRGRRAARSSSPPMGGLSVFRPVDLFLDGLAFTVFEKHRLDWLAELLKTVHLESKRSRAAYEDPAREPLL